MGFKPKDSIIANISQLGEPKFDEGQFVEDVFSENYVLIVGSEVIMDKSIDRTGDINHYILETINRLFKHQYKDFNELISYSGRNIDLIRNLLNNNQFSYDLNDISPELRMFMNTKLFPIVLTTTIDNYLETLMRQIWGESLRVVNIDDANSLRDLRFAISECWDSRKYHEPTLFYIFGKAVNEEVRKYVRTDDDAIQIIEKWMQMPKEDPIIKFIKEKKVLALGCKFDDWYFRFFWYILKRDVSKFREGQVAFLLDVNNPIDQKLKEFLKHSRIYQHKDAHVFMSEVTPKLTSTEKGSPYRELVIKNRRLGGLFLSYCSKNYIIASQLFFRLHRLGYKVWFDNSSLNGGDNYNYEIEKAIREAKIFVPILTPEVADDLTQGNFDGKYYINEWEIAGLTGNKRIIPLAANGYDLRASYHKEFERIIGGSLAGVDLIKEDGFEKLIGSLDKELKG